MASNTRQGNWVSSRDAAAILSVSPKTISRWEAEGRFRLPAFRVRIQRTLGGHRRLCVQDLERLARSLTVQVEEVVR